MKRGALVLSSIIVLILLYLAMAGISRTSHIPSVNVTPKMGHSYWYDISRSVPFGFEQRADSLDEPTRSSLVLLENGHAIGAPHAIHSEIRTSGKGRYSHWQYGIYFSSSDNTNPRSNGRQYTVRYRIFIRLPVVLVGICFFLVAFIKTASIPEARSLKLILRIAKSDTFTVALLSSATFLIVVTALEVGFRIYMPFKNVEWPNTFDPLIGFHFVPNSTVRHTNHLNFWTTSKANSLGFLDREPSYVTRSECHVSFIGDSFIEAAQVTLPNRVQIVLEDLARQSHPEWRLTTSAFGYSGTGQLNQLPFYDHYVRHRRPTFVVLVFASNDFANNSAVLESLRNGWQPLAAPRVFAQRGHDGAFHTTPIDPDWQNKQLPTEALTSPRNQLHTSLRAYSYLYNWAWLKLQLKYPALASLDGPLYSNVVLNRARAILSDPKLAPLLSGWEDGFAKDIDEPFDIPELPRVYAEAIDATRFAFQEFKRRTEADGAKLVVLVVSQVSLRVPLKDKLMLQRLRRILDSLSIPLVDQYDYIVRYGGDPLDAQFRNDGHWSVQGHRWAAESILQYLEQNQTVCMRQ